MVNSLFSPIVPYDKLNPSFKHIMEAPEADPARYMMGEASQKLYDKDGNFVEQFQSTAFDARLFELYLNTYLVDSGFHVDSTYNRPDFIVANPDGIKAAIEATTINPTQNIALRKKDRELSKEEFEDKLLNELPIRFGGPLYSKLKMEYWKLEQCKGLPLVFAIEAFHEEGSLFFSDYALGQYLYGLRHFPTWTETGDLVVKNKQIEKHLHQGKAIPSNFFGQPGAENVSCVLFTNSGTYAKFLRIGYEEGHHHGNITIFRTGFRYDHDPNAAVPKVFQYDLDDPPFKETWGQGLVAFHNPNALHPLPRTFFTNATQYFLENSLVASEVPFFHPYASITNTVVNSEIPLNPSVHPKIISIHKFEFDKLASNKLPVANLLFRETEWYSIEERNVIGAVILDLIDKDWSFMVLSREESAKYVPVDYEVSISTRDEARERLIASMSLHQ